MTNRDQGKKGFTLVEVKIALGMLSIGVLGIFATQAAALYGQASSRTLSDEVQVARLFTERLRMDATRWNKEGPSDIADTTYFDVMLPLAGKTWSAWQAHPFGSPLRADGNEDAVLGRYCVQYRARWFEMTAPHDVMLVEVRVFGYRPFERRSGVSIPLCAAAPAAVTASCAASDALLCVQVSDAVRRMTL